MRGRCPVQQGGIGNAREVERATAQVRDSMDEFRSFVSTARSAERSFSPATRRFVRRSITTLAFTGVHSRRALWHAGCQSAATDRRHDRIYGRTQ
jgi:hypothetical protein